MEMADSIRVSADLLLTVINDILDFSKMEADKMKVSLASSSLLSLISCRFRSSFCYFQIETPSDGLVSNFNRNFALLLISVYADWLL